MRHTNHVSGTRTINYDLSPHRCPMCNHICNNRRKVARPGEPGRHPETQEKLLDILRERDGFVPAEELAQRLGIHRKSVVTVVYRARKNGAKIDYEHDSGYSLKLDPRQNGASS